MLLPFSLSSLAETPHTPIQSESLLWCRRWVRRADAVPLSRLIGLGFRHKAKGVVDSILNGSELRPVIAESSK